MAAGAAAAAAGKAAYAEQCSSSFIRSMFSRHAASAAIPWPSCSMPMCSSDRADAQDCARVQSLRDYLRLPAEGSVPIALRCVSSFRPAKCPLPAIRRLAAPFFSQSSRTRPTCTFQTEIRLEEVAGLVPVTVTRIADRITAMFTAPVVPYAVAAPMPSKDEVAAGAWHRRLPRLVSRAMGLDFMREARAFSMCRYRRALHWRNARSSNPIWSEVTSQWASTMPMSIREAAIVRRRRFRARMFAPAAGIPEDPATGSATALLAAQLLRAESARRRQACLGPGTGL